MMVGSLLRTATSLLNGTPLWCKDCPCSPPSLISYPGRSQLLPNHNKDHQCLALLRTTFQHQTSYYIPALKRRLPAFARLESRTLRICQRSRDIRYRLFPIVSSHQPLRDGLDLLTNPSGLLLADMMSIAIHIQEHRLLLLTT